MKTVYYEVREYFKGCKEYSTLYYNCVSLEEAREGRDIAQQGFLKGISKKRDLVIVKTISRAEFVE